MIEPEHSPAPRRRRSIFQACAVTPAERGVRAVIAVIVAAAAVTAYGTGTLALAIPATLFAGVLTVGAVTGWCPTALISRPQPARENTLGIPEARQRIDID